MGQNWNFYEERLKQQAELTPFKASAKRVAVRKSPAEKARLDAEVAQRFEEIAEAAAPQPALSRVEKVMRKNAPDLAGASEAEVRAAQARNAAHLDARWPRPRLAALVLVGLVMWLHPLSTVRLFVCAVLLFLVAAVTTGPERARDGSFFLWRRFLRYWKVELVVARKLFRRARQRMVAQRD
ncbi:hypothetical protein [Shimia sediminis]|uniref:hypothetical protein n=1 Tax=Shimia sediminis TaxID=2497945 RepID=UPI000F8CEFB7|nr:hypothetical protein [Shimia sediminis]